MTDFKWPRFKQERIRLSRVTMIYNDQFDFELLSEHGSNNGVTDHPPGTVEAFCKEHGLIFTEIGWEFCKAVGWTHSKREEWDCRIFAVIAPTPREAAHFKLRFNVAPPILKE